MIVLALLAGCTDRVLGEQYDRDDPDDLARMCEAACDISNCSPMTSGYKASCFDVCLTLRERQPYMPQWCLDTIWDSYECVAGLTCEQLQQRGNREFACFDELAANHDARNAGCYDEPGMD